VLEKRLAAIGENVPPPIKSIDSYVDFSKRFYESEMNTKTTNKKTH
jgi:hypothetical protein